MYDSFYRDDSTYIMNFGPHHPSTHGVLRLVLKLSGEIVVSCFPEIGYLYRGVEKLCESKKFLSITPILDRVDYLAPLLSEHAYVMALESILNVKPPIRSLYIRTIFDELTRISSHIMGIGSATYDIGCLSLFLYGFEEREKIMDILEETSGARMHPTYYVVGGVFSDINDSIIDKINKFINGLDFYIDAVVVMALENRIFQKRTKGIGVIKKNIATEYGITGANARASGINFDIRKIFPYAVYERVKFDTIVLQDGDSYSRVQIRLEEIKQSISIIKQCLNQLPEGEISNYSVLPLINRQEKTNGKMQELLYSDFFVSGLKLSKNSSVYKSVESPRGEFGIFLSVLENQYKPHRLRIRSSSFATIQLLQTLLVGENLHNVTAILGSLDFLMGDCDR